MPHVPTLETERLRLVALGDQHFEALARLHSDAETMRYLGDGRPLDRVGSWLHLAMLIGHWTLRGYGVWALESRQSAAFVGRVGFLHPEGWSSPELNWVISPPMRGRGLATEAARAALRFGERLGCAEITSLVRPDNRASAQVARRLGASLGETIQFLGQPAQVYRYRLPLGPPDA